MVIIDTSKAPQFFVYRLTQNDNGIGGFEEKEEFKFNINGYIDLLQGDEVSSNNAFIQESTHILITDYRSNICNKDYIVDSNKNKYNITLVDDPVNLHHHLEIYLKFTGVKNDI